MILTKVPSDQFDDLFTFELNGIDQSTIARMILDGNLRCPVRLTATGTYIGNIDLSTMQFKPLDRAKAGVEPVDLSGSHETLLEYL